MKLGLTYLAIVAGVLLVCGELSCRNLRPAKCETFVHAHTSLQRWGLPEGTPRYKGEYMFAFDGRSKTPRWVIECLTHDAAGEAARSDAWHADRNIPQEFRPGDADYRNARGFDRGHLASAANYGEQADQDETFSFSNCAPQNSELNRGLWAQLEKHIRALTADGATVWVITCPVFDTDRDADLTIHRIGNARVWVPSHFAKTALILPAGQSIPTLRAWIVPNLPPAGGADFDTFAVSVDEWEARTGLDVWSKLPKDVQAKLEAMEP